MHRAAIAEDISFAKVIHRPSTIVHVSRTGASTPTPRNASTSLLTALFAVVGCVLYLYKSELN